MSNKQPFWKRWEFWATGFIAPIITGLVVLVLWLLFVGIKSYNIHLYSAYAYEYNYRGATYEDPKREILSNLPIEIKLDTNNRGILRLAIHNSNVLTLKKGNFYLDLPDGVKAADHREWVQFTPNKAYYLPFEGVNNGTTLSLQPIFLEFAGPKTYKIPYAISGEDIKFIKRYFLIKAVK